MSITKISLQNLVARVVISPPPTTLGESTAVLKKLQSFGRVVSFTASSEPENRLIDHASSNEQFETDVAFSSRKTIDAARAASPFTVRVNHDLPDPMVEDPYNVRNLQSRKQPLPKSMVCHLEDQSKDKPFGQSILSDGFSPSLRTRLYQSLTDLNPPRSIAAGLAVFHIDSPDLQPTPDLVDPVPNLMEMYRSRPVKPEGADEVPFNTPLVDENTIGNQ